MADFAVGAARDLPLNQTASWDGGEANKAIFDWAGGDEFDSAKARRAFLAYDRASADQRGAYKLPFARPIDGTLTAVRAGLNNAASRLSQTDMPGAVKDNARKVIDAYQAKYKSVEAPRTSPAGFEIRDAYDAATEAPVRLALRTTDEDDDLAGVPGYDGYFCTWNTVDQHGTFFTKGAFKRSLKGRAAIAPVLWQHQPELPIGTHAAITEDERGVYARTRLIEGVQAADECLALLRGGVALGLSFGFKTIKDRSAKEDDELDLSVAPDWAREAPREEIRAITEVALWESSPVTFASNQKAVPSSVRAEEQRTLLASLLEAITLDDLDPSQERLIRQLLAAWQTRPEPGQDPGHFTRDEGRSRQLALKVALLRTRYPHLRTGVT